MSGYTEHYNLKKPAQSENYNVEDANTNNTIIDTILFGKIDKVAGKNLSSNDFTNEYKLKLDAMGKIYNYLGTVQNLDALGKIENSKKGDLYHVQSESADYAWNGTEWQKVDSNKGDTGVGITEIICQENAEDSGVNVITIRLSDGRKISFNIRNGSHGEKGETGEKGTAGIRGSRWLQGTKITGTSTTALSFPNSGITDALVNDIYLNMLTGTLYKCTNSGNAAVAKWVYTGSLISEEALKNIKIEVSKMENPIGHIRIETTNINPSTYLGFGTWVLWGAGRVPVGVNTSDTAFNTVEKTGGEKTHVLTRAELPAERLKVLDGKYLPDREVQAGGAAAAGSDWPGLQLNVNSDSANAKMVTENMGSGNAHNNLQPYITCYMWKRTA